MRHMPLPQRCRALRVDGAAMRPARRAASSAATSAIAVAQSSGRRRREDRRGVDSATAIGTAGTSIPGSSTTCARTASGRRRLLERIDADADRADEHRCRSPRPARPRGG
jgi:hypothetical protein